MAPAAAGSEGEKIRAAPPAQPRAPQAPADEPVTLEGEPREPAGRRKKPPVRARSGSRLWLWLVVGGVAGFGLLAVVCGGVAFFLFTRGSIPDSDWKEFSPPGGGYAVLLPGTPTLDNAVLQGANGNKYVLVLPKANLEFAVAHIDRPPGPLPPVSLAQMAGAERDALMRQVNGKLLGERDVMLGRYPGREFQIEAANKGVVIERLYLSQRGPVTRFYLVMVGGKDVRAGTGHAAKFLDSFAILPAPEPPRDQARPPDKTPKPPDTRPKPPPDTRPKPPPETRDLQPGPRIDGFLTAAVDPEGRTAFVLPNARLLRTYTYPDFQIKGTYSIGGVAYRSALDARQGLLYLAVADPKVIRVNHPNEPTVPPADVHVYQVKGIIDGKVPPGERLDPVAVVPVGGHLAHLMLSPDGRWLYYLDVKDPKHVKAGRVNTRTREKSPELRLADRAETLCLSRDGKGLYATATVSGHVGSGRPDPRGQIQVLDPVGWKVVNTFAVNFDPYDADVTNAGVLYVTSGTGGWTYLSAVDGKTGAVLGRWRCTIWRDLIRLSPDEKRMYLAKTSGSPQTMTARLVPEKFTGPEPKQVGVYHAPGILGSDFSITPDGRFLLTKTGQVLKLARPS
jgi:hypothetical protein